jgi:Signal transduction histidine kinase
VITSTLPTQYAPAERATTEDLNQQVKYFITNPLQSEVLNAVPIIVVILNERRQIVFANRAMDKFMKLSGEHSSHGKRHGEVLQCIHAIESEGGCGTTEYCRTCGAVRAILVSQKGNVSVQEYLLSREGNLDPLELRVTATPLNIYNGTFTIFTITDISHEKRRRALERIFFHDVLNTTGGLTGYFEMMEEENPQIKEEYLITIKRLLRKLIDEIKAQVELAAAESNELAANPKAIDSINCIQEVCEFYRHHIVAENRTICVDPNAKQIMFVSDSTLLRRVLGNMIKNALEASPENGIVTVGCAHHNEFVEFWVHNTSFIPRNVQLQIFQRSFSTNGSNRGLGTYSMKLLSERYLHGKVSFTTSQEEGTTFRVTIPLVLNKIIKT